MITLIKNLFYLFLFLLPWQTRYIYNQGYLNGQKWEYATLCLYASELLLALILLLAIISFIINRQKISAVPDPNRKRRMILGLAIFTIFILNCLAGYSPALAFHKLNYFVYGVAIVFIIIISKPELPKIAWALCSAGALQASLAINQFATQTVYPSK